MYREIKKNKNIIRHVGDLEVICNFNDGAYIEARSSNKKSLRAEIFDSAGRLEYACDMNENMWCKTSKNYFQEYTCKVIDKEIDRVVYEHRYDARGKRVYIALESKSVGDTMAWFPYAEEFRKKHGCKVICSTFWNGLFEDQYPEIEFVQPGSNPAELYATYRIGLYFDSEGKICQKKHRSDPTKLPLMKLSSDILGLEYKEVRPRLKPFSGEKKKRVGIGVHSTAQAKYWNNPTGWQEVTDFLLRKGYEVVIMSKEEDGYMGNNLPKGAVHLAAGSLEKLIEEMNSCEFFMGISSGLSWVAWATGIPTVLISGFTADYLEPAEGVVRIANRSVCNDCWSRRKFDPGDWNWCPDHKGTERQFECSKLISGQMVIDRLLLEGLVEEDADLRMEKALEVLREKYEVVSDYSGSWEVSTKDIILMKK